VNDKECRHDESAAISYTELEEAKPGEPFFHEWNTYLRALERLLGEGREGKFVLIQKETIVEIFDTEEDARREGLKRYLLKPFLVQQIRSKEPNLRMRGYNMPWPVSPSPLAKPASILGFSVGNAPDFAALSKPDFGKLLVGLGVTETGSKPTVPNKIH